MASDILAMASLECGVLLVIPGLFVERLYIGLEFVHDMSAWMVLVVRTLLPSCAVLRGFHFQK